MILDVFLVVRIMVDETRGFCGIPLGAVNKIGLQARHVVHIHLVGTGFGIEFLALLSRDGPHGGSDLLVGIENVHEPVLFRHFVGGKLAVPGPSMEAIFVFSRRSAWIPTIFARPAPRKGLYARRVLPC